MRVIHVAPTPFGEGGLLGGGERYPLELARALARHVPCQLVTFGDRAELRQEPGGLDVKVLRPLARWRGHPAQPLAPGLVHVLAGADVVHTHHTCSAPSLLAASAARARRQQVVTTDHGLGPGRLGPVLPRLFDRFLTVSAHSGAVLRCPPALTRVVYGGVDPDRFRPDPAEPRDGVLFVGRLTPHKGVDRLLLALPGGARLVIAGSTGHDPRPPERDYPDLLARLSEGRAVEMRSRVPEHELPTLYRRARVLALPTVNVTCYGRPVAITELLGLAVLEAMASGTPVVCSRVGALPEVVADGETGFLVEPGDVDGLRRRLELLLGDDGLAAEMGAAARQAVLDRFTWEACARRCLDAYAELV